MEENKLEEDDNVDDYLTPQTIFTSKGLTDQNASGLQADDIIQFERKGFESYTRLGNEMAQRLSACNAT